MGAVGGLTILVMSVVLSPTIRAQQLVVPPCTFRFLTGRGCPGCGLTTAFTYISRGQILEAFHANPMALYMYAVTVFVTFFSIYRVFRPVPVDDVARHRAFTVVTLLMVIGLLGTWVIRYSLGVI